MEKALGVAYRYLAFRPRTVHEVKLHLEKKALKYGFTPGEITAAIELLLDQGYLNDREFVQSFVTSRNSLKPKSKRVLELELKRAGVSQTDIDSFFSLHPTDESELALKALKKKGKMLLGLNDEKNRFTKAISFLQRRGFSFDVAKKAYLQLMDRQSIM